MDAIITNLLSGLIGSIAGGLIAGYSAVNSVRQVEYFRHTERLKSALRNLETLLKEKRGHPAGALNDRVHELNRLAEDVLAFAGYIRKARIRKAWELLAFDPVAKTNYNLVTTPTEYTTKGTDNTRELIIKRITELISLL